MSWWDQADDKNFVDLIGDTRDMFAGMIPEEDSLNRMILNYLSEREEKVPRRLHRADGFHPSAFGYLCVRCEVFKRLLPRARDGRKFPPNLILRFEVGHAVHDRWQCNLLGKMRILKGTWMCSRCTYRKKNSFMPEEPCPKCRWQVNPATGYKAPRSRSSIDCAEKCKWPGGFFAYGRDCGHCERGGSWTYRETTVKIPDLDIVGHCDGVVLYNGEERLLEMKTKDVFAWENMTEPMPAHVIQTNIYMMGMGLKRGVIAYINKNSGEMKEFLIERDPAILERVESQIDRVRKNVESTTLPNGVCASKRDQRARECPYSDICFLGHDDVESLKKVIDEGSND